MDNDRVVSTSSGRFRGHVEGRVTSYELDYYWDKVGAGPEEARLSHDMMSALVLFARDDIPMIAAGQEWPVYQPGTATSVHWGAEDNSDTTIGPIPKLAQSAVWEAILGY